MRVRIITARARLTIWIHIREKATVIKVERGGASQRWDRTNGIRFEETTTKKVRNPIQRHPLMCLY